MYHLALVLLGSAMAFLVVDRWNYDSHLLLDKRRGQLLLNGALFALDLEPGSCSVHVPSEDSESSSGPLRAVSLQSTSS